MDPKLTYVLPLSWTDDAETEDLTHYLRWLSGVVEEVIVVDGSDDRIFSVHAGRWSRWVTHVPPDPSVRGLNGKVPGVVTGVRLAANDKVVIADDDVRYDQASLRRCSDLLEDFDLVRPQNHFTEVPWHAAWDTARTLLNRAVSRDFPGTLGLRRAVFMEAGGYDGDVFFENLELIRTFEALDARTTSPSDLFVGRRPPTSEHFWSQRVRQAYDDFSLPWRMTLWLSIVPWVASEARRRRGERIAGACAVAVAVAEFGRRRGRGRAVFPPRTSLFAPLWLFERAVCSWLAVGSRLLRGGVPYRDGVIVRAANPRRRIRRRVARSEVPSVRWGP